MHTALDIDEDVLIAAKEIARQRGSTFGKVLSDLARQALTQPAPRRTRNGLPLFPVQPKAGIVAMGFVNQLGDETTRRVFCWMSTC